MPWLQLVVCCLLMAYAESAGECSNPPPGVRQMVRGIDITKLDLVPLEIIGSNGFMSPVINFTCSDRTWRSPTGAVYQLPDQVCDHIWHFFIVKIIIISSSFTWLAVRPLSKFKLLIINTYVQSVYILLSNEELVNGIPLMVSWMSFC